MPYTIKKGKGSRPYKIVKKSTGKVVGSSKTAKAAGASMGFREGKYKKRKRTRRKRRK